MAYTCGFCGVHTAETDMARLGQNASHPDFDNYPTSWKTVRCAECERPTLMVQGWSTGDQVTPTLYFPPEGWRPVSNIDKVPKPVAEDYLEAVGCLTAGHFKAAAVLARRAVQGVCIDLGADPEKKLYGQIDWLKEAGEVTKRLAELAHNVRLFGNDGAHPGEDGLDGVTADAARHAIRFLEHLLEHVYIIGD